MTEAHFHFKTDFLHSKSALNTLVHARTNTQTHTPCHSLFEYIVLAKQYFPVLFWYLILDIYYNKLAALMQTL